MNAVHPLDVDGPLLPPITEPIGTKTPPTLEGTPS